MTILSLALPAVSRQELIAGAMLGVVGVAAALPSFRPIDLRAYGEKWAVEHKAWVDSEFVEEFDRRVIGQRRARGISFLIAAIGGFGWGAFGSWGWIPACLGAVLSVAVQLALMTREASRPYPIADGRPHLARLRPVSLKDLLSPRRLIGLALLSLCGVACVPSGAIADLWTKAGPWAIVVVVAPAVWMAAIAVAADRVAKRPEPAVDAASLYFQDAWRQDYVDQAVSMGGIVAGGVVFATLMSPWDYSVHTEGWHTAAAAAALGVWFIGRRLAEGSSKSPSFRPRLWPTLAPDQVLRPGDVAELGTR